MINDSKHQNENEHSERQTKRNIDECQAKTKALNVQLN